MTTQVPNDNQSDYMYVVVTSKPPGHKDKVFNNKPDNDITLIERHFGFLINFFSPHFLPAAGVVAT